MNLVDELRAIVGAFHAAGVRYALCGGIAVTIHGAVRSTKDVDVVIAPEDVDRALSAVFPLGYKFVAMPMTFDEGTPRERHVQRITKIEGGAHLLLDLMLADAAFAGALDDAEEVVLDSGPIRVVSRDTLLRMKRLAGRPQDIADLERLGEQS